MTILLLLEFKKSSPYKSKKVNSVTKNKSEIWNVSSMVQSMTFNSLTVPSGLDAAKQNEEL